MILVSEYYGPLRTSRVFHDQDLNTYVTYCYQEDELVIKDVSARLDPAEDLAEDWVR